MNNNKGTVAFVNEKVFNNSVLHSFKLRDDNTLYMCGKDKPAIAKGNYIEFEAYEDSQGRTVVVPATITVREAEVLQPGTVTSGKPAYSAYRKPFGKTDAGAKDEYWKKREESDNARQKTIEYQAARNSAIAAATVILSNSALKLPAKEADKYAAVMGLIGDLTARFFAETSSLGETPVTAEVNAKADPMADLKSDLPEDWE